jgi:hypothetical protein
MMRLILMWIWMVPTANAQWAHSNMLSGVAGLGMEPSGLWGGLAYPATMEKGASTVGFFGEKRFMTDLAYYDLGWLGDLGGQPFQVRLAREGNASLSVTSASAALSRKINEDLSIAVRLGYVFSLAKGYGSKGHPVAGFGALFKISSRLNWALQADGVNDFFTSNAGNGYLVRMGLGYRVSDLASLSMEVTKNKGDPVYTTAVMSYAFGDQLRARIGYAFQLGTFSCALGFRYARMDIELFSAYHLSLGAGAGLSLTYHFKRVE